MPPFDHSSTNGVPAPGPEGAKRIAERRRSPRYPAAWPVRLWLTEQRFLFGRAVDVSAHGMCLVWSSLAPADTVDLGETYRVDVKPDPRANVRCVAVVRHRRGDTIGVETLQELPVERLSGHASSTTA
jgi:hypothetical protein